MYLYVILAIAVAVGQATALIIGIESGKGGLALDLIEACVEESGGTRSCTMTYALDQRDVTINIGGVQVFCREGQGGLEC